MTGNWHSRRTRAALSALLFGLAACGETELPGAAPPEEELGAVDQAVVSPPSPTDKRYTNFFQKRNPAIKEFNWQPWPEGTREVEIAGKTIVFDEADENKLIQRIKDGDVSRLDIYADKVIVKKVVEIPGAEVHIHARELRFEDVGGVVSRIDTTPKDPGVPAAGVGEAGKNGQSAGQVFLNLTSFYSQDNKYPRFRMNGGKGQVGGQGTHGTPAADVVKFSVAHPDLLKCAKDNGVAKSFKYVNGKYVLEAADLTVSQLESGGIGLDQPFPENGGNATPGGKAGSAGNAGSLHANLNNLGGYAEMLGGVAGVNAGYFYGGKSGKPSPAWKLADAKCQNRMACAPGGGTNNCIYKKRLYISSAEQRTPVYGTGYQSPNPDKQWGDPGSFVLEGQAYGWLHPHAVAMTLAFVEDAYLNGFKELAASELTTLDANLDAFQASPAWEALNLDDRSLLEQQELRAETLSMQLASKEDYFGNPEGWVPALSLEANKLAFEQEVQWAIRTIYVVDWLSKTQNDAVSRIAAIEQAKGLLKQEIGALEAQFNEAIGSMPQLKLDAETAAAKLTALEAELQVVEGKLLQRATQNVEDRHKVPFWKKGLRILASVARLVPVGQPYLGAIGGTALDYIASVNTDEPWDAIKGIPDQVKAAQATIDEAKKKAEAAKKAKDEAKPEEKKTKASLKQSVKDLYAKFQPVIAEAKKHKDLFKDVEAPKEEIQKELEKLKGEDPEFKKVTDMTAAINKERESLVARMADSMKKLEESATGLGEHYLQLSEFLPEQEGLTDVVLTQRAMVALGDMRAKAVHRLLKYHYLLAKSYEYTMLHPYTGDLTLTKLFNEVLALLNGTNPTNGTLTMQDYNDLYVIFRNEVSDLVEEVLSKYQNVETQPLKTHTEFDLDAAELAQVNAGLPVTIDFAERGLFGPEAENLRLSGLEVTGLTFAGAPPSSPNFVDVVIEHDGMSRIFSEGVVHVFKHYNKKTKLPLRWVTRSQNGTLEPHVPSPSQLSLLLAILDNATADIHMFALPSPWAKYYLRTSWLGAPVAIASLRLKVTYEYEPTVGSFNFTAHQDLQNTKIRSIFMDQLEREPTAAELRQGRELLDLGYEDGDIEKVVQRIYETEMQGLEVDRLYVMLYSRDPSAAERAWWSLQLVNGRTIEQTTEYIQLITEAVNDIYGRQPTYSELKLYTKLLDQGLEL